jgi:hypothetical protein
MTPLEPDSPHWDHSYDALFYKFPPKRERNLKSSTRNSKKKVPAEQADRARGEDEAVIKADIAVLKKSLKSCISKLPMRQITR